MNLRFILLTCFTLFCTFYQAFSFQNTNKLLSNPDIIWVGEIYVDYIPNINIHELVDEEVAAYYGTSNYNCFDILKVENQVSEDWVKATQGLLSHRLLQLNAKNLTAYKDANLSQKMSYTEYQEAAKRPNIDTIITFDPNTFEEIVQVVEFNLTPNEVEMFRVKQVLAYNEKSNQLSITPVAIAPLTSKRKYTPTGEVSLLTNEVLFWMPLEEVFKNTKLSVTSINWAKRLTKDISSSAIKTIKGTGNLSSIFDKMVAYYKKNSSTSKLYYSGGEQLVSLSPFEVEHFGHSVDTIITFHPETFEEIVEVLENHLEPRFAKKIRIVQDWVWNSKKQKMQVRVLGFAPVSTKIYYEKQYGPVFQIKAGE